MQVKTTLKTILVLSAIGLLFAGYLTFRNIVAGNVCPLFFEIPACYVATGFYIVHVVLCVFALK